MVDLIRNRKTAEDTEQRHNLFSRLLDANDNESISGGEAKLSTRELLGALFHYPVDFILLEPGILGNMFIFQLAGHEVRSPTFILHFP